MTFRSLQTLWLLGVVPFAFLFLVAREHHRIHVARRFVSERLRGVANGLRPLRPWLIAIALSLMVIAAAGPRAGYTTVNVAEHESNRIVVLDVSNSMAANDVGTTRLAAAKAIARRIITVHPGRIALIVFEGSAEVVSPLTNDVDAVAELLASVEAGEVGQPGSDIGAAIAAAVRLAESDPAARADVVLISDGEDQGTRLRDSIGRAKQLSISISTVLVGSAEGSTIPMGEGKGELRDDAGNIVTTYAHAETLQWAASSTGGTFLENPFAERALDPLLTARRRGSARQTTVRIPIERYQWPLAMAILALFLGSFVNRGAE